MLGPVRLCTAWCKGLCTVVSRCAQQGMHMEGGMAARAHPEVLPPVAQLTDVLRLPPCRGAKRGDGWVQQLGQ